LWERAREAAERWFADSGVKADARRAEAWRWVGADILDERIPEKLLKALDSERGEAAVKPKAPQK
jgi:hypothetical protein